MKYLFSFLTVVICVGFGSSAQAKSEGAKSATLARREAKLRKIGVPRAKIKLVLEHERKFENDRAALRQSDSADETAERNLVLKHENFLKKTLGAKMFAAYYMSAHHWSERRLVAAYGKAIPKRERSSAKKSSGSSETEDNFYMTDEPLPPPALMPPPTTEPADTHRPASEDITR